MDIQIIIYIVAIIGGMALVFGLMLALAAKKLRVDGGKEVDSEPTDDIADIPHEVVMVRCSGGNRALKKFDYVGIDDCHAALMVGGSGPNDCLYSCLGMGSCLKMCRFNAISLRDGVAIIDTDRCDGCKACVAACPRGIVTAVPLTADVVVACNSHDRGDNVRQICEIGCIGCSACSYACKYSAIRVKDNLAEIDYEKCMGCGDCAEKCPRKLIVNTRVH